MSGIWGSSGDWYHVEYTVGNDPIMRSARYKFKATDGMIEGRILTLLGQRHNCDSTSIKLYGAIFRGQS